MKHCNPNSIVASPLTSCGIRARVRRLGRVLALAGLALATVPAAAAAGTSGFTWVGSCAHPGDACLTGGTSGSVVNVGGAPLSQEARLAASAPGVVDQRRATATAAIGKLQAASFIDLNNAATAGSVASTSARSVYVGSTAGFSDIVQVVPGGLAGTSGILHASWAITGNAAASGGSASDSLWTVALRLYAQTPPPGNEPVEYLVQVVGRAGRYSAKTFATDSSRVVTEHYLSGGTWLSAAVIDFPIPITFGASYGMSQFINADASAGVSANGKAQTAHVSTDFGHTVLWNGISSVTDASGAAVSGWDLVADSGVHYAAAFGTAGFAAPVPEPGSGTLIGLGAVALAGAWSRRRCRDGQRAAGT